jgi:hypothetical protein
MRWLQQNIRAIAACCSPCSHLFINRLLKRSTLSLQDHMQDADMQRQTTYQVHVAAANVAAQQEHLQHAAVSAAISSSAPFSTQHA